MNRIFDSEGEIVEIVDICPGYVGIEGGVCSEESCIVPMVIGLFWVESLEVPVFFVDIVVIIFGCVFNGKTLELEVGAVYLFKLSENLGKSSSRSLNPSFERRRRYTNILTMEDA